jgi:hypothetical protein
MPRIPQGEFDTNPSTRVGTPNVQMAPSAGVGAAKAATGLVGAMAVLQDQTERTEAYQVANDAKNKYLQQKATYEAALETVNGKGEVDYFDPNDPEPDINKRRRIKRPASEMYKEMVDSYEESKKEMSNIARPDIAQELARQYVGDDLIQTQMRTNKFINREREKETSRTLQENTEMQILDFTTKTTQEGITDDQIGMYAAQLNNKINREFAAAGSILGAEQIAEHQKLKDRLYSSAAQQIISHGVTNATVKAADTVVSKIKDPSMRSLAQTRLEITKKSTAESKSLTTLNQASGLEQAINAAPAMTDQDYVKTVNTVKQTLGIYTDPKYNAVVTPEMVKKQAGSTLSTAMASRQSLELMDVDMSFLANPALDVEESNNRTPAGIAGEGPKMQQLKRHIAQEIEASGLSKMMGGDSAFVNDIVNQTVEKMKSRRTSMRDNLADMVSAKYPNVTSQEKLIKIQQIADTNALGEVSFVGQKERAAFKQQYETLVANDPTSALNFFNQKMSAAGESIEGKGSFKRAMAIDLAGKDANMAYLIPMADANPVQQDQMVRDAAIYKKVIEETDASKNSFNETFNGKKHKIPALNALFRSSPSLYDGVKQMIQHRAASILHDKGGGKDNLPEAMDQAIEEAGSLYTSVSTGTSSLIALNRSKNYNNSAEVLKEGLEVTKTMPHFTKTQKLDILNRYKPKIAGKLQFNENTPDSSLDLILQHSVHIEPHGKYPNVHVFKMDDAVLADKDGETFTIDVDKIEEFGSKSKKARIEKSFGVRSNYQGKVQ